MFVDFGLVVGILLCYLGLWAAFVGFLVGFLVGGCWFVKRGCELGFDGVCVLLGVFFCLD